MPYGLLISLRVIGTPLLVVLALAGMAVTSALCGVRGSGLDSDFYLNALAENHVYDRVYSEYLRGTEQQDDLANLLGGVAVPSAEVETMLRAVLPPNYLQQEVERNVQDFLAYLKKDTTDLTLTIHLKPVLDRVGPVAVAFAGRRVSDARATPKAGGYAAYVASLSSLLSDLRGGQLPAEVPATPALTGAQRGAVADLILGAAYTGPDRPEVDAALAAGDTGAALRAAMAVILGPRIDESVALLRQELGPGEVLDITEKVAEDQDMTKDEWLDDMEPAREVVDALNTWALLPAVAILVVAVVLLGLLYLPGWRRAIAVGGIALAVAGLLALAGWFTQANVAPGEAHDTVLDADFSSPEMRAMVADVAESLMRDSSEDTWPPAAAALGAGLAVVAGVAAWPALSRLRGRGRGTPG